MASRAMKSSLFIKCPPPENNYTDLTITAMIITFLICVIITYKSV